MPPTGTAAAAIPPITIEASPDALRALREHLDKYCDKFTMLFLQWDTNHDGARHACNNLCAVVFIQERAILTFCVARAHRLGVQARVLQGDAQPQRECAKGGH
jgi:hypothetical protein